MTSWVLGGRDPSEVKSSISSCLLREESAVLWLEQQQARSSQLTQGMLGILDSFEGRLAKLEGTILPVYQETDNLQRRQENIDRTLDSLDHVIAFYNVSKETEGVVRAGPGRVGASSAVGASSGEQLEHYLHTMSRLKGALDYFEQSNPQSIELENVKLLYELGGEALSREFSELVKQHSRPLPAVDLLNSIAGLAEENDGDDPNDLVSIHHFAEDVQTSLIQIAEWLNLNDHDEFMHVFASVRGQVTRRSLDGLRDHQRSSSGGSHSLAGGLVATAPAAGTPGAAGQKAPSPSMSRKFSSPAEGGGSATPTGRRTSRLSTINRKFSTLSTRMEAAAGLGSGRRSLGGGGGAAGAGSMFAVAAAEEQVAEWEVEAFCLSVSALQRLMSSEQVLMVGIVPHQYQKKIFEMIIRDSVDLVVGDGDGIIARVKKSIANHDFLAIMTVFHIVRHLVSLQPLMDRTLEGCDAAVRSKYNGLLNQFFGTGSMALDGFLDGIRADSTTREKMPRDGTVFQLTSNVMLFLEQLLDYVDTIAAILTQDTSYNQTLLRLPRKISVGDRNHALVGLYIKKILVQLNLTLVNKSDTYADQFLKAVFRLNNNQYILRSLQKTRLLDVVSLAEPQCEENYNDMILEQKRLYSQSWSRVLTYIWSSDDIPSAILQAPGKLQDKYCRLIKEKFAGFNREIEDISGTQRSYSVPDLELRESLKRDNKEYILPKYNGFYEKYANVAFTKHPEKYVRYTSAQVSALIDCFFDAAA